MLNNVLLCVSVVYLLCFIIFSALTKRFFKTVIITALIGVLTLIITKIFGGYFGFYVPINIYTLGVCGFTGLPGVFLILILNIIFI